MTKGLESLQRITLKDFILNNESCLKDIKLIEKELKVLEIITIYCGKELYITLCSLLDHENDNELELCKEVLL